MVFEGPGYDRPLTLGGQTANEVPLTALVVGLMSIFMVVSHTRADEEAGRADLVRAAIVGRSPPDRGLVEIAARTSSSPWRSPSSSRRR